MKDEIKSQKSKAYSHQPIALLRALRALRGFKSSCEIWFSAPLR